MTLIVSATLVTALAITVAIFMLTIILCDSKKHLYFLPLIVCVGIYIVGYMFEINSASVEAVFYSHMFMYCGACFVAPLYLLFIADFVNTKIRRWQVALVIGSAMFNYIVAVTSPYQKLYFQDFYLNDDPLLHSLGFSPGPAYMPFHLIQYFFVILAIFLLLFNFFRTNAFTKRQAVLLLIGGILPFTGNILFALRLELFHGLNLTPTSMVIVIYTFFIAIKRYNLFDLIPVASKQAIHSMNEAFIVLDYKKHMLESNPAAVEIFPEINGRVPITDCVKDFPEALSRMLDEFSEQSSFVEFTVGEESIRHLKASVTRIADKGNLHGWSILINDVTETINFMKELERHATTDALTGIHNRRYFLEHAVIRLTECSRMKKSVAIIMFDLDKFKTVNDTYGHPAGDAVLCSAAKLVAGKKRLYDLFARYGGEEFILFLPEVGEQTAVEFAERIRAAMEANVTHYEGIAITRTISIGVCVSVDGVGGLNELINIADTALYQAKENGRNCVKVSVFRGD